jgi:hypothetical protein
MELSVRVSFINFVKLFVRHQVAVNHNTLFGLCAPPLAFVPLQLAFLPLQLAILPLQLAILPLQLAILPLQLAILPLQLAILPLQLAILPLLRLTSFPSLIYGGRQLLYLDESHVALITIYDITVEYYVDCEIHYFIVVCSAQC